MRIYLLFAQMANLSTVLLILAIASLASRTMAADPDGSSTPDEGLGNISGTFVAWTSTDEIVVNENGNSVVFNIRNRERATSVYAAPSFRTPEEINRWLNDIRTHFPESVLQRDPVTGKDIEWKSSMSNGPVHVPIFVIAPDAQDPHRAEGEFAVFSAEGRTRTGEPSGKVGTHSALYALLYRKGKQFKLLPLELASHHVEDTNGEWNYAWGELVARVDHDKNRTLLYFQRQPLESDVPWQAGWGPFNAWWFDPATVSIQHVILPDGPWVADATSDGLGRAAGCFSCGCGCYRAYDLTVAGGKIFARITAEHNALNPSSTGIYELPDRATSWRKISDPAQSLDHVAPDGCKFAIDRPGAVQIVDLCAARN